MTQSFQMPLRLCVKEQAQQLCISKPEVTVGRGLMCDLRFPKAENRKTLSRDHAVFLLIGGQWYIRDEGSTNGTYLNDTRLESGKLYPLKRNDRVTFSNVRTVVFDPEQEPAGMTVDPEQVQRMQEALNKNYPGMMMLVRDVDLPESLAAKYEPGLIIREKGFVDASCRVMGMVTTHRYAILSNHMANLSAMDQDTHWGWYLAQKDSRFKVLGVHSFRGKTAIFLLHLPDDDSWKLFQNAVIDLDQQLLEDCIQRFESKCLLPAVPELTTEQWLDRCRFPLGMSDEGELFPLE